MYKRRAAKGKKKRRRRRAEGREGIWERTNKKHEEQTHRYGARPCREIVGGNSGAAVATLELCLWVAAWWK